MKYMDDKRSLCSKIYGLVNIPETSRTVVDKKYYWNQKLVVMINNKMVELKSNFNLETVPRYVIVVILRHGDREVLTALLDCLFAFLPIS